MRIDVDPRRLAINRRYKRSHAPTKDVKAAMAEVTAAVERWVNDNQILIPDLVQLHIRFHFPTKASDFDGPMKRTVDAIAAGMGINDNRIVEACITKTWGQIHPPHLDVYISEGQKG